MWGLTVDEASGPPIEIWPDNVVAHNVFVAMASQWLVGPGGPVGLVYASLPVVMDLLDVVHADRHDVFESIRVMEDAALRHMRAST